MGLHYGCVPKTFFKKGTILVDHSDTEIEHLYLVHSGRVRISIISAYGMEQFLFVAESGTTFGELSFFNRDHLPPMATAVTDIIVYKVPYKDLEHIFNTNPDASRTFNQMFARKTSLFISHIENISFNNPYWRVVNLLSSLAKLHGVPGPDGIKINIKFTHQQMAELAGLSRVSVSNIFLTLERQGVIATKDGYKILRGFLGGEDKNC